MKAREIAVQPAPAWAFNPVWETYGFEESWNRDDVIDQVPLLKELGITTITFDSGWYGKGKGRNWDSNTGDFIVNPDVIGTEEEFQEMIRELHEMGFKVRVYDLLDRIYFFTIIQI